MSISKPNLPLFVFASIASMSGLLMGFDIGIISSILLFIKPFFSISPWQLGLIASMIVPGTMLGALLMSVSGDRLRRPTFILISGCIALLALSACAVAQSANQILMGRLALGIAIGISLVNVPLYLAQVAPEHKRGFAVTFFQLAITFGIMLGSGIGYWLSHYGNWRWMFWASSIIALLQIISGLMLILLKKTEHQAALKQQVTNTNEPHQSNVKLLVIGNILAILHQFTGINAIVYFAPQIFQYTNHASDTTATFATWLILIANFIFTIASLYIFDWFGRRNILMISFGLQTIALFLLGLSLLVGHPTPFYLLTLILVYFLGFAAGLGPGFLLVASELYPEKVRNRAMGITIFTNNIAAFTVICTFPVLLHAIGMSWIFLAFSLVALIGGIVVAFSLRS